MNNTQLANITTALAGVTQAAVLVHQFATTGECDDHAFNTLIKSIYQIDADDVPSVYGSVDNLKLGFNFLHNLFANSQSKSQREISRYVISIMHAAKLLMQDKAMVMNLQKKVKYAISQAEFFDATHPSVINSLGHIYKDTISSFKFRIHVVGAPSILNNEDNMAKVRALLLAGIRSAVLWQQVGGNKWQFIFSRRKIAKCAQKMAM